MRNDHQAVTGTICRPCIGITDATCVDVRPVDCLHPVPGTPESASTEVLYFDPVDYIDCRACERL